MSWDQDKLAALREKYAKGHGGDLFDPSFQKVADKIFSKSGTRKAPYAGVSTLLDAPYRQIDPQDPDFGDLQVALVGVPMDLGVTNRPGARFGPRALRDIERIGPYNHVLGCAPVYDLRSEEHTSELQSLMRSSYAVFCLKKKKKINNTDTINDTAEHL